MPRPYAVALFALLLLAACGEQDPPAQSPGQTGSPAPLDTALYAGGAPEAFAVSPGNTVEPAPGDRGVVVRSTATALNPQGDGNSAVLRIPDEMRQALNGRTVRVTIRARAAEQDGTHVFRAFYSRPGVGSSGWVEFRPAEATQDFTFDYAVPSDVANAYSNDLVGVWADPEGKGRGVEIGLVRLDVTPPPAP